MNIDQKLINGLISELLLAVGEDPKREGLKDTPERVARAYAEVLNGYARSLKEEITVFKNTHNYDDIVYSGKIRFFSTCEHHLQPFFGTAHVAYIPNKYIIGLSKLSRAVDIYSRRLQDQERITMQVANELDTLLKPQGVGVMLEGQHLCNMSRGVHQFDSDMKTMAFTGIFKKDQVLCERFLGLTRLSGEGV
jgi:GTP cyclohydrolase I